MIRSLVGALYLIVATTACIDLNGPDAAGFEISSAIVSPYVLGPSDSIPLISCEVTFSGKSSGGGKDRSAWTGARALFYFADDRSSAADTAYLTGEQVS